MRSLGQHLTRLLLAVLCITAIPATAQGLGEQELRQLMQMAEYIGVDYPEAVKNGEVANSDEYAEMQEFAGLLLERSQQLSDSAEAARRTTSANSALPAASPSNRTASAGRHRLRCCGRPAGGNAHRRR